MPIIEVEHVTKEYRLGAMQSLKTIAGRMIGRVPPESNNFKALDDVSFSIERGEVVGIIGHNGAGKSTLLKMLSRITTPTSGRISVQGKIAPLIEVGAGLVGDMTGRENIYLNATILGLSHKEIDAKVDEIIEFSDLGKFIDTPIKRYSSGMQVKLGFSIATAIIPDILIIDEVLAVGDAAFQRKCIDRMEGIKNDPTRTLLIVGHNIRQLERICDRMLLMDHGRLIADDKPSMISSLFYQKTTDSRPNKSITNNTAGNDEDIGEVNISLQHLNVEKGISDNEYLVISTDDPVHIQIKIQAQHKVNDVEINIGLHNPELIFLSKSSSRMISRVFDLIPGLNIINVILPPTRYAPGIYGVGIGIYDRLRRSIFSSTGMIWLQINVGDRIFTDLPQGTLTYSDAEWNITT